jgi:pyrimidine-nucleoside phosphorylase
MAIDAMRTAKESYVSVTQPYSMYQLIDAKKRGETLPSDAIDWMVEGYVAKKIPDYQAAAFLMAIYCRGMDDAETAALTSAMLNSGRKLDFNDRTVVDKHSTGGIGDKPSFILGPIAAACGVKVPMIAGRGLGHTGGTIDKVEAIKGFRTGLSLDEFEATLKRDGFVLMGQTPEIAPADRLLYALRDVTATIDCVPLITASIMSKKLAEGAEGIVFDIKHGSGAFMRDPKHARELARSLIKTGKRFRRRCVALLTDMSQPLGAEVGHSLEIQESIRVLKNAGPKDLTVLSLELAAHMVLLAGKAPTLDKARKLCQSKLADGSALQEFRALIKRQGGDDSVIDEPDRLIVAAEKTQWKVPKSGYVHAFQNDQIGMMLTELGGGRRTKEETPDLAVGFTFHGKIGSKLKKGDVLVTVHHHAAQATLVASLEKRFFQTVVRLSAQPKRAPRLITQVLKG